MSFHDDGRDTLHKLRLPHAGDPSADPSRQMQGVVWRAAAAHTTERRQVYYEWLQLSSTLPVREFHLDLLSLVAKHRGAFFELASSRKLPA